MHEDGQAGVLGVHLHPQATCCSHPGGEGPGWHCSTRLPAGNVYSILVDVHVLPDELLLVNTATGDHMLSAHPLCEL